LRRPLGLEDGGHARAERDVIDVQVLEQHVLLEKPAGPAQRLQRACREAFRLRSHEPHLQAGYGPGIQGEADERHASVDPHHDAARETIRHDEHDEGADRQHGKLRLKERSAQPSRPLPMFLAYERSCASSRSH
jgi:hypothetical protein